MLAWGGLEYNQILPELTAMLHRKAAGDLRPETKTSSTSFLHCWKRLRMIHPTESNPATVRVKSEQPENCPLYLNVPVFCLVVGNRFAGFDVLLVSRALHLEGDPEVTCTETSLCIDI